MTKTKLALTSTVALSLTAGAAFADCGKVSFSDVGWTDITSTTAASKQVLQALGYKVDVKVLSVPVTFASLESDDVDIFLGNWMPSQTAAIQPYLDKGEIDTVATNLEGTKYTLAVPDYTYEKGLHTYADIHKFGKELGDKIYGIEPGNEGNAYLIGLTEQNKDDLGDFKVVESSEQGMLSMVRRAYDKQKDIVFLGWEPHPMNSSFKLKYLTGGEDFFGGEGVVNTVTRKGYAEECPNVGKFLKQLKFTLPMENEIMGKILNDGEDADKASLEWMQAHPDLVMSWVDGVTTADGGDGAAAVKSKLGL
ncbi:choline ABC transporter substrate-binding protein [Pseudooceanicola sp. CBS1P-1]|uniref:Choline ABC transporter substrate-binding protein n=1 Tax=Pseudooceanicola albus TaxID=2692189 RepID=A0A6L7G106_9RHOB|nr:MULTISPECIES: choline ABC transporter substrate-binding protein [Pseudooceanicola]MBT9382661.1 choline ABC transporter substrate-binding protein [Pseudooceanicola endophyticus]MXN17200.1 choline ABC transporter substrate-binding protein [Pseudooceanicola albus]